jgi:hypothetical protein
VTVTSAQFTSNLVAKGQFLGVLSTGLLDFNPPSVPSKVLAVELPIPAWSSISIITLKNRTLSRSRSSLSTVRVKSRNR